MYSLRARFYNPAAGRFLSRDTAAVDFANPRELNRYSYVANDPINAYDPSGLFALGEYGELNENSGEEGAAAEPLGGEAATTIARNAGAFERQAAQLNYNRFFGRSVMQNGQGNPVTVGQGSFTDVSGVQRQFVGTNNFFGKLGRQFETMAQRMRAANPQTEFLGGRYVNDKHFEELAIEYIKRNIGQIPDKGRVAVGVANKICAKRCQPLLRSLGGIRLDDHTIVVTLERGIKVVFVATGLR